MAWDKVRSMNIIGIHFENETLERAAPLEEIHLDLLSVLGQLLRWRRLIGRVLQRRLSWVWSWRS